MGSAIAVSDLIGVVCGDFNNDGLQDILLASEVQAEIAWNSSSGIERPVPLKRREGQWRSLMWDEESARLWVEFASPDRVEQWRWSGTFELVSSHPGRPRSIKLVKGTGALVLGRSGASLELLKTSGEAEVLIPEASALSEAALHDAGTGGGLLLLQDQATGRLGISSKSENSWGSALWLEETENTSWWELKGTVDGHCHLLIQTPDRLKLMSLSPDGMATEAWNRDVLKSKSRIYWLQDDDPDVIALVVRKLITLALEHIRLDATTGDRLSFQPLGEPEYKIEHLLPCDLNGDGQPEVLHTTPAEGVWRTYFDWSKASQRLFWKSDGQSTAPWPSPLRPSKRWMLALDSLAQVEEVWAHRAALFHRTGAQWRTTEALDPGNGEGDMPPFRSEQGGCFQLVIPYLDLANPLDPNPGLAEVEPGVWHHLVYIRREDLHTEAWLDGNLVFQGESRDLRYLHNAVNFGATYTMFYHSFGKFSLDRTVLAKGQWSPERIRAEFALKPRPEKSPDIVQSWDFDEPFGSAGAGLNAVNVFSEPRYVPGVEGRAILFDGRDDVLREFLVVPQEAFTLSLFFKLEESQIREPQTLVQLYGMFNSNILVKWAPRAVMLVPSEGETHLSSPARFRSMPAGWPDGCAPFLEGQNLLLLTEEGQVLEEGPLGWQELGKPLGLSWRPFGNPIAQDGALRVLTQEGTLWQWNRKDGWRLQAHGALGDSVQIISGSEGFHSVTPKGWAWHKTPEDQALTPAPTQEIGMPVAVAWTPFGDHVQFGQSQPQPWLSSRRSIPMMAGEAGFKKWPSWYGRVTQLSIILFTLLGTAWLWRTTQANGYGTSETKVGETTALPALPAELLGYLVVLARHAGSTIDTETLDDILCFNGNETNETRRARRARFIRESNDWAKPALGEVPLIVRLRDPSDRRRSLYVIHHHLRPFSDEAPGHVEA